MHRGGKVVTTDFYYMTTTMSLIANIICFLADNLYLRNLEKRDNESKAITLDLSNKKDVAILYSIIFVIIFTPYLNWIFTLLYGFTIVIKITRSYTDKNKKN